MDVTKSPEDLVDRLTKTGLLTKGGPVKLNRYCSASTDNGGAGTAASMLSSIQSLLTGDDKGSDKAVVWGSDGKVKMKDGRPVTATVTTMSGISYVDWVDVAKGQGQPDDFIKVWNWIYDNLDGMVPSIEISLFENHPAVKNKDGTTTKAWQTRIGSKKLSEYFQASNPDKATRFQQGMAALILDKAWGWDCIGFVANYLRDVGLYSAYPGYTPAGFIDSGGFKEVKSLAEIGPLCVVAHGNYHVQIISSIDGVDKNGALSVTLCQSSGNKVMNGPMSHSEVKVSGGGDKPFVLSHAGDCPVIGACRIGKHPRLKATYPNADMRSPEGLARQAARDVANKVMMASSRLPLFQ